MVPKNGRMWFQRDQIADWESKTTINISSSHDFHAKLKATHAGTCKDSEETNALYYSFHCQFQLLKQIQLLAELSFLLQFFKFLQVFSIFWIISRESRSSCHKIWWQLSERCSSTPKEWFQTNFWHDAPKRRNESTWRLIGANDTERTIYIYIIIKSLYS